MFIPIFMLFFRISAPHYGSENGYINRPDPEAVIMKPYPFALEKK
jgi:hypothetical protein